LAADATIPPPITDDTISTPPLNGTMNADHATMGPQGRLHAAQYMYTYVFVFPLSE
jgi:hypothetical protein